MAVSPPLSRSVPVPTDDETDALRLAEAYLRRASTRLASRLLGRPDLGSDVALAAEFGDALLRTAAMCAGMRDLAEADDRRPSL